MQRSQQPVAGHSRVNTTPYCRPMLTFAAFGLSLFGSIAMSTGARAQSYPTYDQGANTTLNDISTKLDDQKNQLQTMINQLDKVNNTAGDPTTVQQIDMSNAISQLQTLRQIQSPDGSNVDWTSPTSAAQAIKAYYYSPNNPVSPTDVATLTQRRQYAVHIAALNAYTVASYSLSVLQNAGNDLNQLAAAASTNPTLITDMVAQAKIVLTTVARQDLDRAVNTARLQLEAAIAMSNDPNFSSATTSTTSTTTAATGNLP